MKWEPDCHCHRNRNPWHRSLSLCGRHRRGSAQWRNHRGGFLTNDAVYPVVSVYADANTKTFGSYEGEEIPGYTALLIHLEGGYKSNTKVLADGTTLHIVEKKEKTSMNWKMAHCSLPNLSPQLPFCKN